MSETEIAKGMLTEEQRANMRAAMEWNTPDGRARRIALGDLHTRFDRFRADGKSVTDAAREALAMMLPRYRTAEVVTELSEGTLWLTSTGKVQRVAQPRKRGRGPITSPGETAEEPASA